MKKTALVENKVAPGMTRVKHFRGAMSMLFFKRTQNPSYFNGI